MSTDKGGGEEAMKTDAGNQVDVVAVSTGVWVSVVHEGKLLSFQLTPIEATVISMQLKEKANTMLYSDEGRS